MEATTLVEVLQLIASVHKLCRDVLSIVEDLKEEVFREETTEEYNTSDAESADTEDEEAV